MNPYDLYQYHGAAVWMTCDGKRTAMRLYSKPLHDPYVFPSDIESFRYEPHEKSTGATFILSKAQIESLSLREPGILDSDIQVSSHDGPAHHDREGRGAESRCRGSE
jgi:hypothetical protein